MYGKVYVGVYSRVYGVYARVYTVYVEVAKYTLECMLESGWNVY